MYINKNICKLVLSICFLFLAAKQSANAQIAIGTPNLEFSQACASDSFNGFKIEFIFTPESQVQSSNTFIVEMSDASGSFANSTIIYTSNPGEIITSPGKIEFLLPQGTAGENYKTRIKSTAPIATGSPSTPFPAYYKSQDSPFSINNLVATGSYCTGGSYLLTIDATNSDTNDSPLNYPELTFNWFKEINGTNNATFLTTSNTLTVSNDGTYFAETNYGTCTSSSFSNRVTITQASSDETSATVNSSQGNIFCPSNGPTILSTISGDNYQWFKDGVAILDATNQTYETTESGTFSVQIEFGGCSASGELILESELFEASINVSDTETIQSDESLNISVTSTAVAPEFQWYLNGVLISGATQNTYNTNEMGNYEVVISETSGCIASKSFFFEIIVAVNPFPEVENIPNIISPNGDNINDTWVIPREFTSGSNAEITIISYYGKIMLQTKDYQNNWPENDLGNSIINQVFYYVITTDNETKKGAITILK